MSVRCEIPLLILHSTRYRIFLFIFQISHIKNRNTHCAPFLPALGNDKRCRKRNIRYFEVLVDYQGIGQVKLYFCWFPYQKKWRLFLSTDISLSLLNMLEIYSIGWTSLFQGNKAVSKIGDLSIEGFRCSNCAYSNLLSSLYSSDLYSPSD